MITLRSDNLCKLQITIFRTGDVYCTDDILLFYYPEKNQATQTI